MCSTCAVTQLCGSAVTALPQLLMCTCSGHQAAPHTIFCPAMPIGQLPRQRLVHPTLPLPQSASGKALGSHPAVPLKAAGCAGLTEKRQNVLQMGMSGLMADVHAQQQRLQQQYSDAQAASHALLQVSYHTSSHSFSSAEECPPARHVYYNLGCQASPGKSAGQSWGLVNGCCLCVCSIIPVLAAWAVVKCRTITRWSAFPLHHAQPCRD